VFRFCKHAAINQGGRNGSTISPHLDTQRTRAEHEPWIPRAEHGSDSRTRRSTGRRPRRTRTSRTQEQRRRDPDQRGEEEDKEGTDRSGRDRLTSPPPPQHHHQDSLTTSPRTEARAAGLELNTTSPAENWSSLLSRAAAPVGGGGAGAGRVSQLGEEEEEAERKLPGRERTLLRPRCY
jgi:hypothetical protein